MSDDLIARLRTYRSPFRSMREAADRIEAQAARIADLHDAYCHSQQQLVETQARIAELERDVKVLCERFADEFSGRLRKPVRNIHEISATIPGGCYCPPDKCGAPVIMGQQTPCLRRAALAPKEPS